MYLAQHCTCTYMYMHVFATALHIRAHDQHSHSELEVDNPLLLKLLNFPLFSNIAQTLEEGYQKWRLIIIIYFH